MRNKQDALAEYYRQLDNYNQTNADMHNKMVLSPFNEKMKKRDMIEGKDHEDFLRRQAQRYDNEGLNNLKSNQDFIDENDKMRKKRQMDRELEKMKQREEDIIAQGEKNAMNIGKEMDLEEERRK